MITSTQKLEIQKRILSWYAEMGRNDLPWRQTDNLYHILISEIMLQQTNVPKVRERYVSFLEKFPDVNALANAKQSDVLRAWQGLGYNRRALNLHKCAKILHSKYDEKVPENVDTLLTLPGIGPYTSNAILIFGKNHDLATIDVNVERVIRRLHGNKNWKKLKSPSDKIKQFVPKGHSREWHEALMDFASAICTKRKAKCLICPLKDFCKSFPDPSDFTKPKNREVGREENGKHVPRRIFRGRIIELLRERRCDLTQIGVTIKSDWNDISDKKWLKEILDNLEKEGMIERIRQKWKLK